MSTLLTTTAHWQDAGLLRERLTEIRQRQFLSMDMLRLERTIVREIERLTGYSAEQIRSAVDSEAI